MIDLDADQDLLMHSRVTLLEARMAQLEAALARAIGEGELQPSAHHFARTQKMERLADSAQPDKPKSGIENLGITAAFACLDGVVAEAAKAESASARKPVLSSIVEIDPSLIEDAFAPRQAHAPRPAARAQQMLRRRSALEEGHPSIARKIEATWRSSECRAYLQKLIISDRGVRAGFDPAVMSELLFLGEILDAPVSADSWSANAYPV